MQNLSTESLPDHFQAIEKIWSDRIVTAYHATNQQTGQEVLLQVLLPGHAPTETWDQTIQKQREQISNIEHPGLLPVLEYTITNSTAYLVSPWIKGQQLSNLISKPLPEKQALQKIYLLAQGLRCLHERGMVHGCLSPERVWVTEDGGAFLMFYGIADGIFEELRRSLPEQTMGMGINDTAYVAPEQVLGRSYEPASDLFSLGAILFALLTGKTPFVGETPIETALKRIYTPFHWSQLASFKTISRSTKLFIYKTLSVQPADRFANTQEVCRILERMLAGKAVSIRVHSPRKKNSKWAWIASFLVAIILVGGIGYIWLHLATQPAAPLPTLATTTIAVITATPTKAPTLPLPSPTKPAATLEIIEATATPNLPTSTSEPTSEPSTTSQATPSPEPKPVLLNTPYVKNLIQLKTDNVAQLQEVARLGMGRLMQASWSNDNKLVAIASSAGVFIWDASGLVQYFTPAEWATSVTFSPDDQILAVGLGNGDIQLWNWRNGFIQQTLKGHSKRVSKILYSPNQRHLISASFDLNIKAWDLSSGQEIKNMPAHPQPIKDISLSEDGRWLASCSGDQKVKIWDIAKWEKLTEFNYNSRLEAVTISPDGAYVAAAGSSGEITQWIIAEKRLRTNPIPINRLIWGLRYTQQANELVVGVDNGEVIRVPALRSNRASYTKISVDASINKDLFDQLGATFEFSSSMAISPDEKSTITLNWDGLIQIEGGFTIKQTSSFENFDRFYFSPDSSFLLGGGKRGFTFLWDVSSNALIQFYPDSWLPPGEPISSNSQMFTLATIKTIPGSRPGEKPTQQRILQLYNVKSPATKNDLSSLPDNARVQFIQDDTLLIAGAMPNSRLWDIASRQEVSLGGGYSSGCQLVKSTNDYQEGSTDRRILSVLSQVTLLREWDELSHLICVRSERFGTRPAALQSNRQRIAFTNEFGLIEVVDFLQGQPLPKITPEQEVTLLRFSPDGSILAGASDSGNIMFWNTQSGELLLTLQAHITPINALAFSPDGLQIVTGSSDGTVRIWAVMEQ